MPGKQNRIRLPVISLLFISLLPATLFAAVIQQPALAQGAEKLAVSIAAEEPPYVNVLLDMAPVRFPTKPYIEAETTMVPLRALGEAVGAEIGWDDTQMAATCSKNGLTLVIRIGEATISTAGGQLVSLPQPAALAGGNTIVPLDLFTEILGYDASWDEATRTIYLSSPEKSTCPSLWGFYALGSVTYSSWSDVFGARYPFCQDDSAANKMEGLFLGWFAVDDSGKITSEHNTAGFQKPDGWPSVILRARLHGMKLYSMYFADSGSQITSLLDDPGARLRLALDIAGTSAEYDGILIDFEGLGLDENTAERDKANFNEFLTLLRDFLDNKSLAVALPPVSSPFRGYDHRYIGDLADLVVLMAYNFQDPDTPSPVAPFDQVDNAIRQESELVSPDKIILGVPAYGVIYGVSEEGQASVLALPPSKDGIAGFPEYPGVSTLDAGREGENVSPAFVPEFLCNYVEWEGMDRSYKAYFEDARSLEARVLMAHGYGLRGVAVWRLGLLPENWWGRF